MNTRTDLANASLSYIGQMLISDIDDLGSQSARACKEFIDATIDEVLRSHPWSCAIRLMTLTEITTKPEWGYKKAFQLPSDMLRLLQINGQAHGPSQEYYDIQGSLLLSNWHHAKIRYVKRIIVPEFDALLAEAIALKLAAKICVPLSQNIQNQQILLKGYNDAVNEAKRANAIEQSTNANPLWGRVLGQSNLLRSRGWGYSTPYRFGFYNIPYGPY